ncbi:MAG: hypothetical protein RL223_453 [Pseudomonadota bacterium]|jgi:phenylalanine-4-hydroxylase
MSHDGPPPHGAAPPPAALHGLHGLAAVDAGRPERADWTVPQHWLDYDATEHATWARLWQRQHAGLQGRACSAWLRALDALPIDDRAIPDFDRLNAVLQPRCGWQVVAVPGLVPDAVFFGHLAARRFPVGRFIRDAQHLDYLQEPDVFHDLYGHVPLLLDPQIGDFIQAYGQGGLRAQALGMLPLLARVYWYTVEFGLLREAGGLRIWGAGILSSATESRYCLDDATPQRLAFDLLRVMRTRHRIDDLQACYFVLDDLGQLMALAEQDFEPLYRAAQALPEIEPGQSADGDRRLTREGRPMDGDAGPALSRPVRRPDRRPARRR